MYANWVHNFINFHSFENNINLTDKQSNKQKKIRPMNNLYRVHQIDKYRDIGYWKFDIRKKIDDEDMIDPNTQKNFDVSYMTTETMSKLNQ